MNSIDKNIEAIINYKNITFQIESLELEKEEINSNDGLQGVGFEEKTGKTNKVNSMIESLAMTKEKEIQKIDFEIEKLKRMK